MKTPNNKQKTSLFLAMLAAATFISNASAVIVFEDNFNRPDGTNIGAGWNELTGAWAISSNTLVETSGSLGNYIADYTEFTLPGDFGVSIDIRPDIASSNAWRGIAFNIQDSSNYYAFRFYMPNTNDRFVWQMLEFTGGIPTVLANNTVFTTMSTSTFYTATINVSSPGNIAYTIANSATPTTYLLNSSVIDASSPLTGGYAGIYTTIQGSFDNFILTSSVPEPGATAFFALGMSFLLLRRRLASAPRSA